MATCNEKVLGFMVDVCKKIKANNFYYFLLKLINMDDEILKRCFFVLDNDRSHNNNYIYQAIGQSMPLLFNAPYSPELNLIEIIFSFLKRKMKQSSATGWLQVMKDLEEETFNLGTHQIKAMEKLDMKKMICALNGENLRELNKDERVWLIFSKISYF
jgi:transposase